MKNLMAWDFTLIFVCQLCTIKKTKQYEITKEQLWESFKAQMENEDNISHKVLYCNSCGKTKILQYGTILPVRKEVE